jgi:hypothetical protein
VGLIFVAVPRTGSTSISFALHKGPPRHVPISQSRKQFGHIPAFGFVRNPFSRAVSWFRRCGGDDFLSHLMTDDRLPSCAHYLTIGGRVDVDYIGRFETLRKDFNSICSRLGLGYVPLEHKNSTGTTDWRHFYERRTRAIVLDRFADDFAVFGYPTTIE